VSEETASMPETQYVRAWELFDAGEVRKAREILTGLSERDYAPAQAFLGWVYQRGEGVAPDATEARRLYEAAAANGYSVGQCYLGLLDVHEGRDREGFEWVRTGAMQGYAPALYRLGLLYAHGIGVPADENEAYRCWEKAASLGHPFAQRMLALRLLRGGSGIKGVLEGIW
jgi:uncharacterized protein